MSLEKESETFKKLLPELLVEHGKFAVIHDEDLIGIYSSYDDAVKIGYERCGLDNQFLVKRIMEEEQIAYFSRDIGLQCQV